MAILNREVVIYDAQEGIDLEVHTNNSSNVTITTYGVGGSCDFEVSTDGGQTFLPRFCVSMVDASTSSTLMGEGHFLTTVMDVDKIRVKNVIGFNKIMVSLG